MLVVLLLAAQGCNRSAPATSRSQEALRVLNEAAAALKKASQVEYDFEYGSQDDPTGWATGHTKMRRVTDPNDSWIRVTGAMNAQPKYQTSRTEFDYGVDHKLARLVDHTAKTYEEAPVGRGSNRLSLNAIYGYITEFVETEPFWKETGMARQLSLLEPETVDGVECDQVRALFDTGQGGPVDVRWSIARTDRLPRRGRWVSHLSGPRDTPFTIKNLRLTPHLSREDFAPAPPDGYQRLARASVGGVGAPAPDWELLSARGQPVRLRELRGSVVVLDFWNTWCFICRAIAPQTQALHREFEARGVLFFGVNVFETGDPIAYWSKGGFAYPLLLKGDAAAAQYDIPVQPAIVVIGSDGQLLYNEVGATHDRAQKVRRIIHAALLAQERG
jgi:thiol-disulfide isomerase/thioredoxin